MVGSNILNVLLILGITSVIRAISVQKSTVRIEIPFTIGVTVLLAILGLTDGFVSRFDGGILWAFMILYLLYLLRMAKKGNQQAAEEDNGKKKPVWFLGLMVLVGGAMIVFGSDVTVDAATIIAQHFGMSERFIGLTIVAFGTSLPELMTSVTAALKGKSDIAMGNIVGSNIFNILFVVGTTALITPVVYASRFFVDSIVAIATVVLLLLCVFRKQKLGRLGGLIMLDCYGGYFVYLVIG